MRGDRQAIFDSRTDLLIQGFPVLLGAFQRKPPFRRPGQLEYHRDTIKARLDAGSAVAAIKKPRFIELLYETLRKWGIGQRASSLVSVAKVRVPTSSSKNVASTNWKAQPSMTPLSTPRPLPHVSGPSSTTS